MRNAVKATVGMPGLPNSAAAASQSVIKGIIAEQLLIASDCPCLQTTEYDFFS